MQLTGEFIDADKANDWGLVVDIFEEAQLLPKTIDVAKIISKWSPKAAKMIKEEVNMNDIFPLNESLSLERKLLLWQSKDHDEGINSFIEKRDPNYEDD